MKRVRRRTVSEEKPFLSFAPLVPIKWWSGVTLMRFIVGTFLWDIGADRTDALVIVCSDRVWKPRVAGAVPNTLSGFANVFFYPSVG
jgi:hypothetical protein